MLLLHLLLYDIYISTETENKMRMLYKRKISFINGY